MSRDYDRRCREHQAVIDAAGAYIREHPGADDDEVCRQIPHDDTPVNRMLVHIARVCEDRERQEGASDGQGR